MDTFRVLLEGRCIEGFSRDAVKSKLMRLMRVTEAVAAQLIQGRDTKVKEGVDLETGERYLEALRAAGMACRLEPENLAFELASDASPPPSQPDVNAMRESAMRTEHAEQPQKDESTRNKLVVGAMLIGLIAFGVVFGGHFLSRFTAQSSEQPKPTAEVTSPNFIKPTSSVAMPAPVAQSAASGTTSPIDNKSNDDYETLIARAKRYIVEWNNADPLCERIESPNLDSIRRGVVTSTAMGGKVDPPMPAIVARITGICVMSRFRKKDPIENFFMMMAYDKAFNKFDCVKVGGMPLINGFIERQCEFVESGVTVAASGAAPQSGVATTGSHSLSTPSGKVAAYLKNLQGAYAEKCTDAAKVVFNGETVSVKLAGTQSLLSDLDVVVSYYGKSPPEGFSFAVMGRNTTGANVTLLIWDGRNGPEISVDQIDAPRLARCS